MNTDELDEILDELGFANKSGNTKGRMYSQRYYVAELKLAIEDYISKHYISRSEVERVLSDDPRPEDVLASEYKNYEVETRNQLRQQIRKELNL